jgi:Integrase zinc binding domain
MSSEEEIDTPAKIQDLTLAQQHRALFDEKFADKSVNKSKFFTDERIQEIIANVANWEQEDKVAQAQYRKSHHGGDHHFKNYKLEKYTFQGETRIHLHKIWTEGKKGGQDKGTMIVPQDKLFDTIRTVHESLGHKKMFPTFTAIQAKYYNITQGMVSYYIQNCPTCLSAKPKIPKLKGSAKPILSEQYRDEFQVDLIDYKSHPATNEDGVEMKWILTCKDHFTGFTLLAACPNKEMATIASKLGYLFGIVGFPHTFQSDNETEFSSAVVSMLEERSPAITTVTGRPRCWLDNKERLMVF